jgi:HEAT repeat protein
MSVDNKQTPVFFSTARLGELKRADLRSFFRSQTRHQYFERRAQAIYALGQLPPTPEDTKMLRKLINNSEPYTVVVAAISSLNGWDSIGNKDIVLKAASMYSLRETIRTASFNILASENAPEAPELFLKACVESNREVLRVAAIDAMGKLNLAEPKTRAALFSALHAETTNIVLHAAQALGARKDVSALPELRRIKSHPPNNLQSWQMQDIDGLIKSLDKIQGANAQRQ